MSSRPQTPSNEGYGSRPTSAMAHRPAAASQRISYIAPGTPGATDFAEHHASAAPPDSSPISAGARGNGIDSMVDTNGLRRSESHMSQSQTLLPSRGGTLKKKASLRKTGSIKRSSSRRSSRAGSVRSLNLGEKEKYAGDEQMNSAFYTPVPTSANPTEILATRFQAWRKVLKDLITYFRDIQKGYETRTKTLLSASNVMSNTLIPSSFMSNGGLGDALHILRDFHKNAVNESNKAKELENEVILQLTGLRSDLQQKIKEIKSLSGDFKNSVDRETEGTRKAVRHLQEVLGLVDADPSSTSGKGDPFIVKMAVDKQLERQLEEENYLHRAYLNLESSGRELESIVVGEIQKAYNAYAGIIKREADEAFETVEKLREGPIAMPKDKEWNTFVMSTDQMVDPRIPLRQFEHIHYPGRDHPAAIEVRSGMLERKSKYLKNYTPGWYVLSPTHLHEFKSADRIATQQPIMSLYLPEQKLGSHSEPMSSSHKFMLKGRQTGSMHRGHSWIFRAESYETMMAWFNDIKELTEKRGEERNAFVRRQHARTLSGSSFNAPSIGGSSDGALEEDEADAIPYSDEKSVRAPISEYGAGRAGAAAIGSEEAQEWRSASQSRQRPQPGGRFPSDLNVNRGLLAAPMSPSSGDESSGDFNAHSHTKQTDHDALAGASNLPGSGVPFDNTQPQANYVSAEPSSQPQASYTNTQVYDHDSIAATQPDDAYSRARQQSSYGEWMAPAATGAAVGIGGAAVASHYAHEQQEDAPKEPQELGTNSPPLPSGSEVPDVAPIVTGVGQHSTTSPESNRDTTDTASVTTGLSSVVTEPAVSTETSSRPVMPHPAKSVSTISDLHIPGEYPRAKPST